jgi:hypothetical protein
MARSTTWRKWFTAGFLLWIGVIGAALAMGEATDPLGIWVDVALHVFAAGLGVGVIGGVVAWRLWRLSQQSSEAWRPALAPVVFERERWWLPPLLAIAAWWLGLEVIDALQRAVWTSGGLLHSSGWHADSAFVLLRLSLLAGSVVLAAKPRWFSPAARVALVAKDELRLSVQGEAVQREAVQREAVQGEHGDTLRIPRQAVRRVYLSSDDDGVCVHVVTHPLLFRPWLHTLRLRVQSRDEAVTLALAMGRSVEERFTARSPWVRGAWRDALTTFAVGGLCSLLAVWVALFMMEAYLWPEYGEPRLFYAWWAITTVAMTLLVRAGLRRKTRVFLRDDELEIRAPFRRRRVLPSAEVGGADCGERDSVSGTDLTLRSGERIWLGDVEPEALSMALDV